MPLKLTLELIPRGDERRKRIVGTLDIENTADNPNHPKRGNYVVHMRGPVHGGDVDVWHQVERKDIQRDAGYWELVKQILNTLECESQPTEAP